MTTVLQYAVDSMSVGGLYALMAISLALLFSVMGLMNFAYGELIMIGGYTMYYTRDLPWPVLVLCTVAVVTLVSLLMERVAFRPVRNASVMTLLITSFALSVALQSAARMTAGPVPRGVRPWPELEQSIDIGGVLIPRLSVLIAVVAIVLLVALSWLLKRTALGIQLRASTEDFRMARLVGVRGDRVIASAFAITGVLAAAVALLYVARTGGLTPTMGLQPALIAFVGAVVGGLGSLTGAAAGGFFLGTITTLLQATLPVDVAAYTPALAFGAVIVVLIFRPRGLWARKVVTV